MLILGYIGYWPSSFFFFCIFMDHDRVEVHKFTEKESGQYPAVLTNKAWSTKDSSILPAWVANHSRRFGVILPAPRASHIIRSHNELGLSAWGAGGGGWSVY